mgnify:CR=1 FL=1
MARIKIKLKRPWIAYPGSTIQQSYGEDLTHGYLLWDIQSSKQFDVNFHELINPNPFVTIEWADDVDSTIARVNRYPSGTRFRVHSEKTISQADIKQLHAELKEIKNAKEIIFKADNVVDTSMISAGDIAMLKQDLRDASVHLKLLQEFYKDTEIDEDIWKEVEELLKSYLNVASSSEEVVRNTKWSIKRLEFDNMFAYGKGNIIDFDALNGITGIFAPNRAGKSSVVGTIMYALFNTTDRGPIKNIHIINARKGYCLSKVLLNVNGTDYVVERQSVRFETKKNLPYANTNLNLFCLADGAPVNDLNGEQRKDTDKEIRRLIGTADDFLLTSFSSQNEINKFINEGSTNRRTILSKFLDLDVFEKLNDFAKNDSNVIKAQIKAMPDKDQSEMIETLENDLVRMLDNIDNLESDTERNQKKLDELNIELAAMNSSAVTQADVDACADDLSSIKQKEKTQATQLVELQTSINDLNEKIAKIIAAKSTIDVAALKAKKIHMSAMEKSLTAIEHSYERERNVLDAQQRSVKKLLEVPCGDSFPTCKFIKDSHADKQKVTEQIKLVEKISGELFELRAAFEELKKDDIDSLLTKYDKVTEKESQFQIELSKKMANMSIIESSSKSYKERCILLEEKLKELVERLDVDASDQASDLKKAIYDISSRIKRNNFEKTQLAVKIGGAKNEVEKLRKEKERFAELKRKWNVYELLLGATNKKGIPSQIMRSQLPAINAEISKILQGVTNFTVQFEMDNDSSSMEIYIDYGDSRRVIELASGMEKMMSSLAIRVALQAVSSLPKSDMLFIDEGFGSLDETNVEACTRLLTSLKRQFKNILIISHIDAIKDIVDNMIEITKAHGEKDAKIVYE